MEKEYSDFLVHHGVKGQKWGVRRYQNADGSLTKEGQQKYDQLSNRDKKNYKTFNDMASGLEKTNRSLKNRYDKNHSKRLEKSIAKNNRDAEKLRKLADSLLDRAGKTPVSKLHRY